MKSAQYLNEIVEQNRTLLSIKCQSHPCNGVNIGRRSPSYLYLRSIYLQSFVMFFLQMI